MNRIVRLTEGDIDRIVKRVIKEDYSRELEFRFVPLTNIMYELIDNAKDELDVDDFSDEFEYMDNVIYYVVRVLQDKLGDKDSFWYDEEDEITDYIKEEYEDYIMD
jgi:hypothetical protein